MDSTQGSGGLTANQGGMNAVFIPLLLMAYNFVHVHHTLTKERKGVHTTPAMAAGITDHVWKVNEIVALLPN